MTTWLSSWRRLLTLTAVSFALFLALLAYRVSAGEDPGLRAATTKAAISRPATTPASGTDDATSADDASASRSATPTTQAS